MSIKHPFVPLTEIQHNALTGSMLGDGHLCLSRSNRSAVLMIGRCIEDAKYLEYEASIFSNFSAPRFQKSKSGILYHEGIDRWSGELKISCDYATIASPSFTPYRLKWYKYNEKEEKYIKIVPSDLVLNGRIIAHWLCDDGSMDYNKLPYRLRTEISTHGFTREEVEFLCELLQKRYNEDFLCRVKNKNGKQYWIIKAYDSACRAMFADIDPYFKMDRKRIWDKPESRFWNNPPERQRSTVKDFARRKEIIKETIAFGNDFKLFDLAIQLGYSSKSKSGRIAYVTINKLLKPYLDDGSITKFYDKNDNNTCIIKIKKEKDK